MERAFRGEISVIIQFITIFSSLLYQISQKKCHTGNFMNDTYVFIIESNLPLCYILQLV